MAILSCTARSVTGPLVGSIVRVELTDARSVPVTGEVGGVPVTTGQGVTDEEGSITFNLTPNTDITPSLTYYTVSIDTRSFLIIKDDTTQTVEQALVAEMT